MDEIKDLEKKILYHRELYYRGEPEISDAEFDQLEEKLKKLSPHHPVLMAVGAAPTGQKIKHAQKMLSLEKTYVREDLMKWIEERDVLATFKVDGSSCSLVYVDGKLSQAKTRGDGEFGEDILEKAIYIDSIPKVLSEKINCEIRGEIFCFNDSFKNLHHQMVEEKLNPPNSQRNIVAGILGRKEKHYLAKYLDFFAFELFTKDIAFKEEEEKFNKFKKWGFLLPQHIVSKKEKDIFKFLDEAQEFMNEGDYLVDGAVISYNDSKLHIELGETAHHPRYKIAFKIQGEAKTTKIEDIEWNVSRNGICTPVAIVEKVQLSQAMVTRVTLHNWGVLNENNLKVGDSIEIVRSGEVIPKFLRVVNSVKGKFSYPQNCPSCAKALEVQDIWLCCVNSVCPEKVKEEIVYFVKTIGIDDLSHKRIEEMINQKVITDIASVYKLSKETLLTLDKVKEKMAEKLYQNIQKTKKVELLKFLTALGITGGGTNKCERIINAGYQNLDDILNLTQEQLEEIEGFAEKSAQDFLSSLKGKEKIIKSLINVGFEFTNTQVINELGRLKGLNVCITGALSRKRTEVEQVIKSHGGNVGSSVTSKTSYLVTNEQTSSSSKFKKAKELNIAVLTEEELYKMLED
jgi:DNA ligase (NAD+)